MSDTTDKGETTTLTPEFTAAFCNVLEPKAFEAGDELKYSITALFDKDADLSALKKAASAAARKKWGNEIPANLRKPFRDQGEKKYAGYVPGNVFITAANKTKPGVVDAAVRKIIDPSEIYSGCRCIAQVRAFAYDTKGNKGVAFALLNVQKLRDGERLDGHMAPEDAFTPVAGAGDAGGMFD